MISGGGVSSDYERWSGCRPGFFLPVRVLSRLFRRLFLEALEKAVQDNRLQFFSELEPLRDQKRLACYLDPLRKAEWVAYAQPPFGGPQHVLEYLGRYTHRVAISNQRLLGMQNGEVSFRWKDYKHEQRPRTMILSADEFIRRFLLHALPPGFQRIRYYGLFTSVHRRAALALCRKLLLAPVPDPLPRPAEDYRDLYAALTGKSLYRCPKCGVGEMIIIEVLARGQSYVPAPLDSC